MNQINEDNVYIAQSILKIRQDQNLSQDEFAEKCGVTRQAVSRWEMGISVPNVKTLVRISELFNVSVDSIVKEPSTTGENIVIEAVKKRTDSKVKKFWGCFLIIWGIVVMTLLPFAAEYLKLREMEIYKCAYSQSYLYLKEYPLSIILIFSVLSISAGTFLVLKRPEK